MDTEIKVDLSALTAISARLRKLAEQVEERKITIALPKSRGQMSSAVRTAEAAAMAAGKQLAGEIRQAADDLTAAVQEFRSTDRELASGWKE